VARRRGQTKSSCSNDFKSGVIVPVCGWNEVPVCTRMATKPIHVRSQIGSNALNGSQEAAQVSHFVFADCHSATFLSRIAETCFLPLYSGSCIRFARGGRGRVPLINRHRQNALRTFETFVASTTQPQVKDAVLLETTKAIFAPQSSGYSKGGGDAPPTPQFFEIFRSLGGGKPD
jgi:hypothetical protein